MLQNPKENTVQVKLNAEKLIFSVRNLVYVYTLPVHVVVHVYTLNMGVHAMN